MSDENVVQLDPWQTIVKISGSAITQIAFSIRTKSNVAFTHGGSTSDGTYDPGVTTIDGYITYGEWRYIAPPGNWAARIDGAWTSSGVGVVHDLPEEAGIIVAAPWTQSPFPPYAHGATAIGGGTGISVPGYVEEFTPGTEIDLYLSSRHGFGPRGLKEFPTQPPPYDEVMALDDFNSQFAVWAFDAAGLSATFGGKIYHPVGIRGILQPQDSFHTEHPAVDIWIMLEPGT